MRGFKIIIFTVFVLAVLVLNSEAGVVIKSIDTSVDSSEDSISATAYIGDNGMRVETDSKGGSDIIIFRSDRKVFWAINTKDRTYTEMTKKDILKIKNQMDRAMQMMQEQMKNMPPEQRAMMQQMMKGRTVPAKPEKTLYRKIASGVKVNNRRCDKYEGYRRGTLTEEVCTTGWKDLGIKQKDFRVMQSMADFISDLTKDTLSHFHVSSDEWEKEQGYPGVPVRRISYSMGRADRKTEIQEVRRQSIDPSLFELPKGLIKQSISGAE
jgi:hypothetical protein